MNELDLIRSFRADMPAPSSAAGARAERAWRRAKPPRRRWTPRVVAAAALAAAVAAAALILPSEDDSRLGTEAATAAETLRHAAAATAGGVTRPLRPGEYWYVRRLTAWGISTATYRVLAPEVREDWIGADGTRHIRSRPRGELRFPSSRDRKRWEAAGRPVLSAPSEHRIAPTGRPPFYDGAKAVTYEQLLELPRDPEALYKRMRAASVDCECGNGIDNETFVIAGDLLRDNPLPADLRAAILRAAALIPGIELVENQRDVAGRLGVGVAFDGEGARSVLIFDPKTYELLGENEGDGGGADIESAIVSSSNERP